MSSSARKITADNVLKYRFDGFELVPAQRALWRNGERVPLTPKPLETLLILVEHAGETVSKDDLMAQLWEGTAVEDNNLTQSISTLRKALGERRGENRYVLTEPGRGYRFVAPVERITETTPDTDATPEAPQPVVPPSKVLPSRRLLTLGGVLVVMVSSGAWLAMRHAIPLAPVRRSVAVIPIRELSPGTSDAWIQTALTEMLTSELAAGGKLRVIPAEGASRWRLDLGGQAESGKDTELFRSARQSLGADAVVLGSYIVTGTCPACKIRVDLGLMNAPSGERFGTVIEEGTAADLIALADRLGRRLRGEFGIDAGTPASSRWPVSSAMRDYAEGLKALRGSDPLAARDHLQAALAGDPDNALIHSAMADAWLALGYATRSQEESRRAYELSSSLDRLDQLGIEARYRAGMQQWDRAATAYKAIFQLFPDSVDDGLNLAATQIRLPDSTDVSATLKALRRLPPPAGDDPRIDLVEAQFAGSRDDFERTRVLAHRAAERAKARGAWYLFARARLLEGGAMATLVDSKAPAVQDEARRVCEQIGDRACVAKAWRIRGNQLYTLGDFQQAQEAYSRGLAIGQEFGNRAELSNIFAGFGVVAKANRDWPHAQSYFEQSIAMSVEAGYVGGGQETLLAQLYIDSGRNPEAVRLMDHTYEAAERVGSRETIGEVSRLRSLVAREAGDLDRAQQFSDRALVELRAAQSNVSLTQALAESSSLATLRGDLTRAERDLTEAGGGAGALPDLAGILQLARAELRSAQGRLAEAVREAELSAASFDKAHSDERSARAFLTVADALELSHEGNRARRECDEAVKRASLSPNPLASDLARWCEWRLAIGTSKPAPEPAAARPPKSPELALAAAYARAMRAKRAGATNARGLFEDLARQASARGYVTLARRAATLAGAK